MTRRIISTIRIPMHMIETINKIDRTQRQFLYGFGPKLAPEEVAERLKVMKVAKEQIFLKALVG